MECLGIAWLVKCTRSFHVSGPGDNGSTASRLATFNPLLPVEGFLLVLVVHKRQRTGAIFKVRERRTGVFPLV
ncbi:MAG: hypothetical protein M2R45_01870 [Verrucomicrobia subdivision 3 bacterium]|nr:hypothetical protein [Limisphaerales bacterium]MCS1415670.1 hypothetical protein [Limisphaerales bacterium]